MTSYILPFVLILLAGMAEGIMDYLQFHYSGNSLFWNPSESWLNKYKNRIESNGKTFIGKYFVFLTDGWHLMKFFNHLLLFSSIPIFIMAGSLTHWYYYVLLVGSIWAINRIGFTIIWKLF